jgi:hypothetical protein
MSRKQSGIIVEQEGTPAVMLLIRIAHIDDGSDLSATRLVRTPRRI